MNNQVRTFERGDQVITIAPIDKGLVEVKTPTQSMILDAHAVNAFINSKNLKETTK